MKARALRVLRWLDARYLTVDARTAGLFRIVLAILLSLDCIRHMNEAGYLYSNEGVLTNDWHLFQPSGSTLFSLFHAFSSLTEVRVLFLLGLFCHLNLLVGHRTKLFAFLSLLFVTSRDSRNTLVENGGYVVENLITLYACFLPIEKRFSVDSLRRSLRAVKETSVAELEARVAPAPARTSRSLVGLAVLANLGVLYFFNVVNKTGNVWREGNTVHYVLYINRMVTGLAVFLREHMPFIVLRATDYVVLAIEATICVCILSPRARKIARPLAVVLMIALHGTFGLSMRLGPFSWSLVTWSTLLWLPCHWEAANARYARRARPVELALDPTRPFDLGLGRVVVRLDHARRVRFVEGAGIAARLEGEERWEKDPARILAVVAQALPFGGLLHRALRVATFGLCDRAFAFVAKRPAQVERWLGLTTAPRAESTTAPLGEKLRFATVGLREAALAWLMFCCTLQTWVENKVIPAQLPPELKPGQELRSDERKAYDFIQRTLGSRVIRLKPQENPTFLSLTIGYPRIFQGWGMFAPNPIREDGVLAVDALTIDGRHVDPLTGRAPDLDLTDSRGEGLSQLRQDYGNRIRFDRNEKYREGLRAYLSRYPERTGNPNDRLVAIDVYWVRALCPPPGEAKMKNNDPIPIVSWRDQTYRPGPGGVALPPKLKTRSAEPKD